MTINILLFRVTLIFLLLSCNSNPNNEEKKLGISDNKQIVNAENNARNEIIGLWKIYKKSYGNSEPSIEESNEFFEIKENNTFEESRSHGEWILSFTADSDKSSKNHLIFTKIMARDSYKNGVESYYLNKTIENGTTFLKLTSLSNDNSRVGFIYIRQK